jgi:hypothetical protein|tara:strand:+ start:741 stop:1073 length:333 start_codon:yes stop_codon:yes gene_type:complete
MKISPTSNNYISKSDRYLPPTAKTICIWDYDREEFLIIESKAILPSLIYKDKIDGRTHIDVPVPNRSTQIFNKIRLCRSQDGSDIADLLSESNRQGLMRHHSSKRRVING